MYLDSFDGFCYINHEKINNILLYKIAKNIFSCFIMKEGASCLKIISCSMEK